jgi:uncharacterized protein (UPF0332 family)
LKQSERLLDKASRAIEAATVLLLENSSAFATGRAYYGMFYVAEALLNESGQHFRKHSRYTLPTGTIREDGNT